MKLILQIAVGVAAGIVIGAVVLASWPQRGPSADEVRAARTAENVAFLNQYQTLRAACIDTPSSETAVLVCRRAIAAGCELERRGQVVAADGSRAPPSAACMDPGSVGTTYSGYGGYGN
jgi:hypothetical protein